MGDNAAGDIGAVNFIGSGSEFVLCMDCLNMAYTLGFSEDLMSDTIFCHIDFGRVLQLSLAV